MHLGGNKLGEKKFWRTMSFDVINSGLYTFLKGLILVYVILHGVHTHSRRALVALVLWL